MAPSVGEGTIPGSKRAAECFPGERRVSITTERQWNRPASHMPNKSKMLCTPLQGSPARLLSKLTSHGLHKIH
eukprot:2432784-Pyramimonas_sp.AAC.1